MENKHPHWGELINSGLAIEGVRRVYVAIGSKEFRKWINREDAHQALEHYQHFMTGDNDERNQD